MNSPENSIINNEYSLNESVKRWRDQLVDTVLLKTLYLATFEATKKWTLF